jgi:hypothetical protein
MPRVPVFVGRQACTEVVYQNVVLPFYESSFICGMVILYESM